MTTVFAGERPPAIEQWLERRHRLGQDRYDEIWEGAYHVAPGPTLGHGSVDSSVGRLLATRGEAAGLHYTTAFNLGERDNFRVPDGGPHRGPSTAVYAETAALVLEVLSPGDETMLKFDFYAARLVGEMVVADPLARTVRVWVLIDGAYQETGRSELLGVDAAELVAGVAWP